MVERIIIIGAGQAGAQAIATLRAEGFEGSLTLIGDEGYAPISGRLCPRPISPAISRGSACF